MEKRMLGALGQQNASNKFARPRRIPSFKFTMSRLRFIPALLAALPALVYATPVPLLPGERLTYRVSWSLLGKAGEVEVVARDATEDPVPSVEVLLRTASAGLVRTLYSFDGETRSLFDAKDGRLLSASAVTRSRKKSTEASITLDHGAARATYVDHLDSARNATVPLPASPPLDLVTCLVEAGSWVYRPGDSRTVSVLFDNRFHELVLEAVRYETVRTHDGRREALLAKPRSERSPGTFFKRGGEIRLWLDRDPPRLPIRFEVETKAGTAVALLTGYQVAEPRPAAPPR